MTLVPVAEIPQQFQLGFNLVKVHSRVLSLWLLILLLLLRLLELLLLLLLLELLLLLQSSQESRVNMSTLEVTGHLITLLEGELEGELSLCSTLTELRLHLLLLGELRVLSLLLGVLCVCGVRLGHPVGRLRLLVHRLAVGCGLGLGLRLRLRLGLVV